MNYNFYDRKDEPLPQNQIDWINANIKLISEKENVLFVFQAEYEALVFTDLNIYFPVRNRKISISYSEIISIRIAGDYLIEIKTNSLDIYSIILVSPVDKVKVFQMINLLIDNSKKGKTTSFDETHKIFKEFTVLKYPIDQSQHKIPQVYLKQFGYLENEQWKVSILQRGDRFSRQKSIGSFTAVVNLFDIESEDDRFPRMFEKLNADLENLYYELIDGISENSIIPDKCWEILVQLVPNLMVRSDYWRDFVEHVLNSPDKETFLDVTISVLAKTPDELKNLKEKNFYKTISEGELTPSKLNKILLLFLNYIFHHLKSFDLVIITAPEEKELFTSDNPVNFIPNQEDGKLGLFSKDTELYFPISKTHLAYFHHRNSKIESPLRKLKNRGIYNATDVLTDEEFQNLVREEIISKADMLIIVPGKMNYKREE